MIYTEILVQIFLYAITDFNHGKIYGVEICEYISWQIESQAKKMRSHLSGKIFSWITNSPDQRRV